MVERVVFLDQRISVFHLIGRKLDLQILCRNKYACMWMVFAHILQQYMPISKASVSLTI